MKSSLFIVLPVLAMASCGKPKAQPTAAVVVGTDGLGVGKLYESVQAEMKSDSAFFAHVDSASALSFSDYAKLEEAKLHLTGNSQTTAGLRKLDATFGSLKAFLAANDGDLSSISRAEILRAIEPGITVKGLSAADGANMVKVMLFVAHGGQTSGSSLDSADLAATETPAALASNLHLFVSGYAPSGDKDGHNHATAGAATAAPASPAATSPATVK